VNDGVSWLLRSGGRYGLAGHFLRTEGFRLAFPCVVFEGFFVVWRGLSGFVGVGWIGSGCLAQLDCRRAAG